jgi:hypothetical protein
VCLSSNKGNLTREKAGRIVLPAPSPYLKSKRQIKAITKDSSKAENEEFLHSFGEMGG